MPSTNVSVPERTITCQGERFVLYLSEDVIQDRVRAIGRAITRDYAGRQPILIGVLNGSFMFIADLMRAIAIDCEIDFWKLSSYGAEKVSSGKVTELKKVDADLAGRHVIVVEDIVDTGLSMQYILDRMAEHNPASVRTAVLLHKTEATRNHVTLDYVGFHIPNHFVLGYGLDYGQIGRNLPEIYIREHDPDGSE